MFTRLRQTWRELRAGTPRPSTSLHFTEAESPISLLDLRARRLRPVPLGIQFSGQHPRLVYLSDESRTQLRSAVLSLIGSADGAPFPTPNSPTVVLII